MKLFNKFITTIRLVSHPVGLFPRFSVHISRILMGIWTKIWEHWNSEVEPGKGAEFPRWRQRLAIVAERSIDRRYFNTPRYKPNLMTLLTNMNTQYVQWDFFVHNYKDTDLAFAIGNCSGSNETSFNSRIGIASSCHGSKFKY